MLRYVILAIAVMAIIFGTQIAMSDSVRSPGKAGVTSGGIAAANALPEPGTDFIGDTFQSGEDCTVKMHHPVVVIPTGNADTDKLRQAEFYEACMNADVASFKRP